MPNVFHDRIIDFEQYDINLSDNIFRQILVTRKNEFDSERFFLRYISDIELSRYNFNNKKSLNEFRDICCTFMNPIKGMAGCNLRPDMLKKGIRYAGITISDPNKEILGQFHVSNDSIIYSPIFPFFYEERDLIKFANDVYFTTISFEELVMNQINCAKRFYVHIRDSKTIDDIKRYGDFIMDEINKNQMIHYLTNPEQGEKVLKKYLTK